MAIEQYQYIDDEIYNDEWFVTPIVDIGMSTDNCSGGCGHDSLNSDHYAEKFYSGLSYPSIDGPYSLIHNYNNAWTQTASPDDFSEIGALSDETDFMIYIGHGHAAHDGAGNHLHYDCGIFGNPHTYDENSDEYTYCNPAGNVYTYGMHFGSSEADLRWVWLYTCNFLHAKEDNYDDDSNLTNDNDHVENANLVSMMNGAHIVMGYASRATLCDPMVNDFSLYLQDGLPIYEAYLLAGYTGEASVETAVNHYQKILYIPQARYETIFSPAVHYEYDIYDVEIYKKNIHTQCVFE